MAFFLIVQKSIFLKECFCFFSQMRKVLRKIILGLLINASAVFAVTQIFPDRIDLVSSPIWKGFLIVGLVVGILNTFVKPIIKILSFPVIILTMGLFLLVINAGILWILDWLFDGILSPLGVDIVISGGLLSFVILGVSLALLNGFFHWLLRE